MPKFTFKIEMAHTFTSVENFNVTVEAATEDEAEVLARKQAYDDSDPDNWDAELDESRVEGVELIEKDDSAAEDFVPRCEKTIDMFAN